MFTAEQQIVIAFVYLCTKFNIDLMCLGVNKECAENRDERKTYPA
jgi:hypothetical protein